LARRQRQKRRKEIDEGKLKDGNLKNGNAAGSTQPCMTGSSPIEASPLLLSYANVSGRADSRRGLPASDGIWEQSRVAEEKTHGRFAAKRHKANGPRREAAHAPSGGVQEHKGFYAKQDCLAVLPQSGVNLMNKGEPDHAASLLQQERCRS
jgi:hypothetical protein